MKHKETWEEERAEKILNQIRALETQIPAKSGIDNFMSRLCDCDDFDIIVIIITTRVVKEKQMNVFMCLIYTNSYNTDGQNSLNLIKCQGNWIPNCAARVM